MEIPERDSLPPIREACSPFCAMDAAGADMVSR